MAIHLLCDDGELMQLCHGTAGKNPVVPLVYALKCDTAEVGGIFEFRYIGERKLLFAAFVIYGKYVFIHYDKALLKLGIKGKVRCHYQLYLIPVDIGIALAEL